jgi:uncharacterized protein (TIGR03437 family)
MTVGSSTVTFTKAIGGSSSLSTTTTVSPYTGDTGDSYTATVGSYTGGSPGWLTATPSAGSALPDAALALSANATALAAGVYTAVVTLADTTDTVNNPTATINVTLTVSSITAGSCTSPLSFTYAKGVTTATQSCTVTAAPVGAHAYTAAVGYDGASGANQWLTGASSGTAPHALTLGISSAVALNMTAGPYVATITLTDSVSGAVSTLEADLTIVAPISTSVGTQSSAPIALTYTHGTAQPAAPTATVSDGASNTYSITGSTSYTGAVTGWLNATPTTNTTNNGTLTLAVNTSGLASAAPGVYTASIVLTDSDTSTTTVYVKLTISSPLSASSPTTSLSYSQTATGTQTAAQLLLAVTSTDPAADSYTVTPSAGCPSSWFSATAGVGTASSTAPDTVTMKITSGANSVSLSGFTAPTTCTVTLKYNTVAFALVTFSSLNIVGSGISTTTTSVPLSYTKVSGTTSPVSVSITAPAAISGGVNFSASAATVPVWLTLTPSSGTAVSGGTSVSFAVNTAVAATMAVGNYTGNVTFLAPPYASLTIPVTFGISNVGATLSMKEGASASTIAAIYTVGTTAPAPTVTPYSSDEPLPFSASCAVGVQNSSYTSTANSCKLNGGQATVGSPMIAVAYTWGYPLAVSLDSTLFTLPVGTIVTVTVTVTPTGGANSGTAMTLAYQYTTEMAAPTFASSSAVVPTSVAPQTVTGTSLAVLLNGTNFIGPQSIVGSAVSPTLVFLAGSTTPVASTQITVVSSTQMLLTIPQTAFPTIGTGKTTADLSIGLANQTGTATPAAATVTTNLIVTSAPVVYAITSTASYNNGGLGVAPSFAPYELVSIFGDNFGYSALTPNFATTTVNAQDQVPTSLLITTTGTGATAKSTYLSVTFKDATGRTAVSYSAPILFANQNQINAIVPSGLTVGHTVSVIVTSGASTNVSDGLYTVNIIGNDPGIFTVASDGTGQGAILNVNATTGAETVNSSSNEAAIGQTVAIFMTGLGAPDSTHADVALTTPDTTPFPTDCSAVSLTASATSPGYLQVGNTAKNTITGWTAPTTAWTNIDGAVIQGELLKTNILAPCMVDPITVTFGTGGTATTATVANGGVTWAGFAAGSVAGLYQINVTIPTGTIPGAAVPVTVTITPSSTGYTSQAGVTMAIQ